MFDENLARIRTHRNNIHRDRRLLQTELSDRERNFIKRRMADEQVDVNSIQDFLICGSEKVISHYNLLLASAKTEQERELYRSRLDREQQLLNELCDGLPDRLAA